jgi:hypothetical protein
MKVIVIQEVFSKEKEPHWTFRGPMGTILQENVVTFWVLTPLAQSGPWLIAGGRWTF